MKKLLIIGILAIVFGSSLAFAGQKDCQKGWTWSDATGMCHPPISDGVRG